MTLDEKLLKFYAECKAKGYTDLSNEDVVIRMKVLAMDIGLDYKNIESVYKEACEKERVRLAEEERARELEEREKQRLLVDGELLMTVSTGRGSFEVYRRPDRSVNCVHYVNNKSVRYEGAAFSVNRDGVLSYQYHSSKTVFTGATVGEIPTGGDHQTEAYTTEHAVKSGNGSVVFLYTDCEEQYTVSSISLADSVCEAFKRDALFKKYGRYISCQKAKNVLVQQMMQAAQSEMRTDFNAALTMSGYALEEIRLPMQTCTEIADLVNRVVKGDYPPSESEIYQRAAKLGESNDARLVKQAKELFHEILDYCDSASKVLEMDERFNELSKREKEEQTRITAEREKKTKHVTRILLLIIIIIGLITAIVTQIVIPNKNYSNAIALKDAGEYESAKNEFRELGDYKDAASMISECDYLYAISLAENGKYTEALDLFNSLDDYKESNAYINKITEELNKITAEQNYQRACSLYAEEEYEKAYTLFISNPEYQDTADYLSRYHKRMTKSVCTTRYTNRAITIPYYYEYREDGSLFKKTHKQSSLMDRIYIYDEYGNMIKRTYSQKTNGVEESYVWSYEHEYDSKGSIVQTTVYVYSGWLRNKAVENVFEFDSNAMVSIQDKDDIITLDMDGRYRKTESMLGTTTALEELNEQGDCIRKEIYVNGILDSTIEYQNDYSDSGLLIKQTLEGGDYSPSIISYTYDEEGDCTEKKEEGYLDGKLQVTNITQYFYEYVVETNPDIPSDKELLAEARNG